MSTAENSTVESSSSPSWQSCGRHCRGGSNWGGANIAATILGFVFFWPIGLFMVYWSVTGRHVRELPAAMASLWATLSRYWTGGRPQWLGSRSGNTVFERFQQTQHDRINEIKQEIHQRASRFADFRASARQRAEQKEFNEFMASSPERDDR